MELSSIILNRRSQELSSAKTGSYYRTGNVSEDSCHRQNTYQKLLESWASRWRRPTHSPAKSDGLAQTQKLLEDWASCQRHLTRNRRSLIVLSSCQRTGPLASIDKFTHRWNLIAGPVNPDSPENSQRLPEDWVCLRQPKFVDEQSHRRPRTAPRLWLFHFR